MRYEDHLPHAVEEVEHVLVAMRDGTRLAARLWLPDGAVEQPVPALLELVPYRKRDGTRLRDELHHRWFAGHGYACMRADLRGSGDSEGVLTDEYLEEELLDAEDLIAWLAAQPWCDGAVGMMGISWGGFNALQVAARRPPALEAIITVASTDERYTDDVHYMGGCLLGDNISWASTMFAFNSLPPDPELVPEWRELWHQRLEGSGLWLDTWLRHQHRDDYWAHGSVAEDHAAIDVPVMAVSGWADGYTNAVFRLLEHLDVPRLGLVGPWSHKYPHIGTPGPAIGWLQECVRWWDRWLKGEDTGIEDEPQLRAWMQDSAPPWTTYEERSGRWVGEESWPSPNVEHRTLRLAPGNLLPPGSDVQVEDTGLLLHSPLSTGLFAGKWASYADAPDLPADQQEEDGGALVFETEPLDEPVELLGAAVLEIELAADQPVAMLAARLSDVRPDLQVTRISYGLLNLTHRDGHERPRPLEPGTRTRVRLQLNDVGQRLSAGHRLRLSLSSSYWPLAWLPPEPVMLTVFPAGSRLHVPVRPRRDEPPIEFEPPAAGRPGPSTLVGRHTSDWRVVRDLATNTSTLEVVKERGRRLEDIDLLMRRRVVERSSVQGTDHDSATVETHWERELSRGEWRVRTVTHTVVTCDADRFHLHATLDAFEGDQRVHASTWDRSITRDLV